MIQVLHLLKAHGFRIVVASNIYLELLCIILEN